jgi:6-phosphogluconolactonase
MRSNRFDELTTMIIVVFGVSGSGKSTIGAMLAGAIGASFLEGDDLHSTANIDKMTRGTALTDVDRAPWLAAIHARIIHAFERGDDLVVACSALKRQYRRTLADGVPITWVYLRSSRELVRSRLNHRPSHFMKSDMLASQFEALEEPSCAILVDASAPPDEIVEQVLSQLPRRIDVRLCADLNELSLRVAAAAVGIINASVQAAGRCSLVLSGGDTPRRLYALLASDFRDQIAWAQVHVFWGDERYVPAIHPGSNYRMARDILFDHVPCPAANIHPMPTHLPSPDVAALEYEQTLREFFGDRLSFDLNLLGLGADAHTASLFPGSAALQERSRWVVATKGPAESPLRLSMTLPALTQSANLYVLVAGSKKASALQHVLSGAPDPANYPASGLRFTGGTLIWWADQGAAAQLSDAITHRTQL